MNDKLLAILVLIGMVVYFFAKVILPIILGILLICGLVCLCAYIRERIKSKREEKESLEHEIANIEKKINTVKSVIANDPQFLLNETIFLQSYLEILLLDEEISKERYRRQYQKGLSKKEKAEIDDNINQKKLMIEDHKVIDSHIINTNLYNEYTKLFSLLVKINMKCDVWGIRNNTKRVVSNFTTGHLYGVVPSNNCKTIWVQVKGVKYYFYPEYIVQVKGESSISCITYDKISPKLKVITESSDSIRGAKVVGYTYLHTCIDGSPDLRYKYNPRSTIYEYRLLQLYGLSNFTIYITNNAVAGEFEAIMKQLRDIAKGANPIPNNKKNVEDDIAPQKQTILDQDELPKELGSLSVTMKSVLQQFGNNIITDNRFIHILDDYHAFEDDLHYVRNIVKLLQSNGYAKELLSDDISPQKMIFIKQLLSRRYAIQEEAIERTIKTLLWAIKD